MRRKLLSTSAAALALALALGGCTNAGTGVPEVSGTGSVSSQGGLTVTGSIEEDTHLDSDDFTWDSSAEIPVQLADGSSTAGTGVEVNGNTLTFRDGGTYRLSGTLTNGRLQVDAGDEVVRLVFDGVTVTSSDGSPFVVQSANEAIVYLAEGTENELSDAAAYADASSDAPDAAIYSMADLTLGGLGSLTVNGSYNDAIVSKDGLAIAGGTLNVNAADDGIRGKDYVVMVDGSCRIQAAGDGVKSDNEEDEDRGWVLVSGGSLDVSSGDDAVKAHRLVTVTGGSVQVTDSYEGIEAAHIAVGGGDVSVVSSDDALNAAGDSTSGVEIGGMGGGPMEETAGDYSVVITGGNVTLDAGGDGLDSNGSASITGGTVVINGPEMPGNGALDVNGSLSVDGGILAAAGSAGMAMVPGESSAQSAVQLTFNSPVPAGTTVQLADPEGALVATFVTAKNTESLVYSSPEIQEGTTYTVYTGGTADVGAGVGTGTLDGAAKRGTAVGGQYRSTAGPGTGR